MYRFIDSLKVENGRIFHLPYHLARMNKTLKDFFGDAHFDPELWINRIKAPGKGLFKLRLLYSKEPIKAEFIPYQPKTWKTLRLVHTDSLQYGYKYADRSGLQKLFEQRGPCDDILIVHQGLITDASSCNVVFFDGKVWVTPAQPLLPGTCRQRLLDEGMIIKRDIPVEDIRNYQKVRLINAFYDLEEAQEVEMKNVVG